MPRQGGVVPKLYGRITLLPKYRVPEAIYGLDGFSHIWLLWDFSESHCDDESGVWSPTVRPPRLGGNKRMGVFATRSPFRPNSIGLSVVKLEKIDFPDIYVSGVDLMDGTPIYDIKPYIPYADCHEDAVGGYADRESGHRLDVVFPDEMLELIPDEKRQAASDCLADDPRPAYQNDPARIYSMAFAGFDIRFTIDGDVLRVTEVVRR